MCRNKNKPKRLSNEDFNAIYDLLRADRNCPIVKYPQNGETSQKWKVE